LESCHITHRVSSLQKCAVKVTATPKLQSNGPSRSIPGTVLFFGELSHHPQSFKFAKMCSEGHRYSQAGDDNLRMETSVKHVDTDDFDVDKFQDALLDEETTAALRAQAYLLCVLYHHDSLKALD